MIMKKLLLVTLVSVCSANIFAATPKKYALSSPDGTLTITVERNSFRVEKNGTEIIAPSQTSMELDNGTFYSINAKTNKVSVKSYDRTMESPVYKKAKIRDCYNEMTLTYPSYKVIIRAYDEAVAYRFASISKKPFKVVNEQARIAMGCDCDAHIPYVRKEGSYEKQFFNSFENTYTDSKISAWDGSRLAFLPLTMENVNGCTVCITESDLRDYPGMYVTNTDGDNSLETVFAPVPKTCEQGGHNMLQSLVKDSEMYIASCDGAREFPWRIINVAESPVGLLDNDMTFKLGKAPADGSDFNWVKPGKVAWDWWNDWNIRGVDFESGINNNTYRYYIDFASEHGIEYVILDEGWSVNLAADLMQVVPEIDLPMLVRYADSKGVGLILWAGYLAFERDMENVCRHYSDMGIKGFKIDFMDRDDSEMVAFYWKAAETAAKYRMLVDFHGAFKPVGLQRTFPNVLNHEGVFGLEQLKWDSKCDMVRNDCILPFTRMVAGCMDYTQGAMLNGTKKSFHANRSEPMSQGTRCHQLALYSIFESPLNMLCDSPSNYMENPECLDFIAKIPTTWDETVALDGKVGEYVVVARRKGDEWYVGAITNWDARDLEIDLSRLNAAGRSAIVFADGANAARSAKDYRKSEIKVSDRMKIHLAPGGGWTCRIL